MQSPELPENEVARLAALRRLGLLDTPAEQRFNRITRTAGRLFGVPISLVSLIDAERQWFKSRFGLQMAETGRDMSFCGHAILADQIMVVEDAQADARFQDNPLVTGPPHIRFYAGRPLTLPGGEKVGTLCLLDRAPRSFNAHDRLLLNDLAEWVERELNLDFDETAARARYQSLAESVDAALLIIDSLGQVDSCNRRAAELLGRDSHEIVGQVLGALLESTASDDLYGPLASTSEGSGPGSIQARLVGAQGIDLHGTWNDFTARGQRYFTLVLKPGGS